MKLKVGDKVENPKLEPGMAVHCDTMEKAKVFLQECEKQNIKASDGTSAMRLDELCVWNQLKENTCYGIETRKRFATDGSGYFDLEVAFDKKDYYSDYGFNVVSFDELFKESSVKFDKINKEAVRVTGNTLEELQEELGKSFKQVASAIPKPPKNIKMTESEEGNPMILIPRYEVLYEKKHWVDGDVRKVMQNGRSIIVVLDGGEKGIAKCHPGDKFDMVRGYNIAYARAKIEVSKLEIEYFKRQLNSGRARLSGYENYLELISKDKSNE